MAILKPSPSLPTRFSAGTSTSSRWKPPVLPARIPHFSLRVYELKPLKARSTMKAESPLWSRFFFFSWSVQAMTRKLSATSARLIQVFSPFSR